MAYENSPRAYAYWVTNALRKPPAEVVAEGVVVSHPPPDCKTVKNVFVTEGGKLQVDYEADE